MTEQHGPEADAWIVRARREAEKEGSAPKPPLYAVRPKRLEWERGRAKSAFGEYQIAKFAHGSSTCTLVRTKFAAQTSRKSL